MSHKDFLFTQMHENTLYTKKEKEGLMHSKILKDSFPQWVNQLKDTQCFAKNSTITANKTSLHSDWHILPDTINTTACDQQ